MNLSRVMRAAEMAIRGDTSEVVAIYGNNLNIAVMDPALAELSVEIVSLVNSGEGKAGDSDRLANLRNQLLGPLKLVPALLDQPAFGLN
jgi:hypothetical protein